MASKEKLTEGERSYRSALINSKGKSKCPSCGWYLCTCQYSLGALRFSVDQENIRQYDLLQQMKTKRIKLVTKYIARRRLQSKAFKRVSKSLK